MAPSPCSDMKKEFGQVFHRFDEDCDGKLSPVELRLCLRTIGEEMSVKEAEALVQSLDTDGDGLLDFEEFIGLIDMEEEDKESEQLKEAFGMYVMEGEGSSITAKSLKRMLSRLGTSRDVEECMAMIRRFDLNGDGVLSFEEFKLMMI